VPTSTYVLLGRASWLFYTPRPAGMDYEGVRPFTTEELNRWQRVLEHRREWLERHNCHYLLFIPPDKQTIYAEYLDPKYRLCHPQSRLDQLLAHLREQHSKVEILDIRQPMLAAKEGERLYHRTDSHWNDRGAFVGYRELVGLLRNWFPAIRPWPRSAFRETTSETKGGDLATMVELSEREREVWLNLTPLSPRRARLATEGVVWPKGVNFPLSATVQRGEPFAKECDDPRLPRAVVFHDSFCEALEPFLSEHFRRIAYLWRDDFHPEVIEREKPDVVIQEILERKLGFVIPHEFDR
jgi:alginate O-acetyltransferase complex protein AlgJ